MKKQDRSRRVVALEPLETRALMTMTTTAQLPDVGVTLGGIPATIDLDQYFKKPDTATNIALINTNLGTIPVALNAKTTPATVANFLDHVGKGDYSNTLVDHSVVGSAWESGGYKVSTDSVITPVPTSAPIKSEAGGSSERGTIATAPAASGSGSDSSRFVLNVANNSATPNASGSTVFGHVLGDQGRAVMDAVATVPVPAASPLEAPLNQTPLQYYTAGQPVEAYNLVEINNVTTANEYFTATSDNPGVVAASVDGSNLAIQPGGIGVAHIAVTGYGSDGVPVSESFTVDVNGRTPAQTRSLPSPTLGTPQPAADPTLPIPVTPPSTLVPSARGTLPTSVVAGQKTKIAQTVTLTNNSGVMAANEQISLSLSRTGAKADYTIASSTLKVNVVKQAHANLATNRLNAAIPAGNYHLLVSVTDPGGGTTTTDTGEVLTVLAPRAKRSAR